VLARYAARVAGETEGSLDRGALGRIVFADEAERRWLEALVHPLVRERFERELAALAAAPVVVLMIPLLFEAGLEGLCSEVWLVDCEEEQQRRRLMERDGLGEEGARARLAAQWPLARKRALADLVIDNRGQPGQLAAQVPGTAGDPGTGKVKFTQY
jgi:dephospho-CoA kinase